MKVQINADFGRRIKKGDWVEVDKIKFDSECNGAFSLRVVGVWKEPQWFSIAWFVEIPKGVDLALRNTARNLS